MLESDEIFHFYLGDPVEMLQLHPDGRFARFHSWTRFEGGGAGAVAGSGGGLAGHAADWRAARWRCSGCSVMPGFDFADYQNASVRRAGGRNGRRGRNGFRALTRS